MSEALSGAVPWPLHPRPHRYESLEPYVRRLAECYGVRYETFCRQALGIPITDSQARWFRAPAHEVLQRLADGLGLPVEYLEQMTFERRWKQLMDELHRLAATPEGRTELERYSSQWLLQNS